MSERSVRSTRKARGFKRSNLPCGRRASSRHGRAFSTLGKPGRAFLALRAECPGALMQDETRKPSAGSAKDSRAPAYR